MSANAANDFTNVFGRLARGVRAFVQSLMPDPSEKEPVGQKPAPVTRKVLAVIYAPHVKAEQGRKLWEVMGWNNPDQLLTGHIADLKQTSRGYANYEVVERVELDKVPVKADGFV